MTFDEKELFDLDSVCAYSKYEITQVKKIVAQPDFPPRRPPMPNGDAVWSEREVREWAETREAA